MRYHDITKDDMKNGDGLRVVLWLAGCDHACPGCQNPITWDPNGGLEFDRTAKEELWEELKKPYISGITFSGGDPFFHGNREEVGRLIREIRLTFPRKTIWVYTGYRWEEIRELPFLDQVDVLVDGRYEEGLRDVTLCWKGSANQRVIDVKKTLEKGPGSEPVIHCLDHWFSREEIYLKQKGACCGENCEI